jgi:ribose transport system ATP-binding protein
MSEATPTLALRGISKRYGSTAALTSVDFDLRQHEVHALMGENGAGKSTLMKILAGTESADSGRILLDGQEVSIHNPLQARAHGIATIHQELNTVPSMTVAENLALGMEPRTRYGTLDRRRMRAEAVEKLRAVGSTIDPSTELGSLSVGLQQMVEIARAVSEDARILVLDEPTAALSRGESEQLFRLIDQMRTAGVGLVYISHRMEEVGLLADRVTILRDGRLVGTLAREDAHQDEIVRMMVGRQISDLYAHAPRLPGEVALRVAGLTGDGLGPADFSVARGEVVAMSGLVGSGRTELARLIFGADRASSGQIEVLGHPLDAATPSAAIAAGIGMLPESRKDQGLFLEHSVSRNMAISDLRRFSNGGVVNERGIRRAVTDTMERLHIRTNAIDLPVSTLSGGNQQKAALGRWLIRNSEVVFLDEPTRGVDIGAKREIYELIDGLARAGKAVLVISSDLPEAIGISDRLLVVRNGRIVAELNSADATEELVMAYATGTRQQGKE